MEIDLPRGELAIKLVYCGPALSGKTTNLARLSAGAAAHSRGRLLSPGPAGERTLFFDLLPLHFRLAGLVVKIRVYTVPGQEMHRAARKLVLAGVDGIAFVADSRVSEAGVASSALADLRSSLTELGLEPGSIPIVFQFNKRDLPDVRSSTELAALDAPERPVFAASALHGDGVLPTFFGLCRATWESLDRRHGLCDRFGLSTDSFLRELAALFEQPR